MVTTIIVLLPLFCPQKIPPKNTNRNQNYSLIPLKNADCTVRASLKCLCRSTLSLMNLADDVLQLNLNASPRKPEPGGSVLNRRSVTDRSRPVMPQLESGEEERGAAIMQWWRLRDCRQGAAQRRVWVINDIWAVLMSVLLLSNAFWPIYTVFLTWYMYFLIFISKASVFERRNGLHPWKIKGQVLLESRTLSKCSHLVLVPFWTFYQNVIQIRFCVIA